MRMLSLLLILALAASLVALPPVVSNVTTAQRTDGSKIIDIHYDVQDADGDTLSITVSVSSDGGQSFTITPGAANLTGDVGDEIMPGNGKSIAWSAGDETYALDGDNYVVKITAWDADPVPEGFALAPAGAFRMGDTHDDGVGNARELPVHWVNLSAYYVSKFQTTHQQVIDVYNWALGENFITCNSTTVYNNSGAQQELINLDGGSCAIGWNGSQLFFTGSDVVPSPDCPALRVTWYGALAFCNFLSLQEGRTPCYDLSNWSCDFTQEGYRLLTSAEWEYAARGATNIPDYLYAGSNNADSVAWYAGNPLTQGVTHPVGELMPNRIDCFDMSGNLFDWCWDWSVDSYYQTCYNQGAVSNPLGPVSGDGKVGRGNHFFGNLNTCRITSVYWHAIENEYLQHVMGFRICRSAPGYGSNTAPVQPHSPAPGDGATMVQPAPTLAWSCHDPDGQSLTYNIYLGTSANLADADLVATGLSDTIYAPALLDEGTTYHWQVLASDGQWVNISPVWSFTTMNLPEMILVNEGTFTMGRDGVATPTHSVTLDAFEIGKYEITQQEYLDIMGENPSDHTGNLLYPVEQVSWFDAVAFCNALSIQADLDPCYTIYGEDVTCDFSADGYRLPTEAEWEYAARGATNDPDFTYAGSNDAGSVAWYAANSGDVSHPVGEKQDNSIGAHDMSGNISEWVWDRWDENYYSSSPVYNPTGPSTGSSRVYRSGSFGNTVDCSEVAYRSPSAPTTTFYKVGFRLCRTVE